LHQYLKLLAKGAESNIYLSRLFARKAVSKIRIPKSFRQQFLDAVIRKQRTIQEARMISLAKDLGLRTPFIYLVDPYRAEIVMEYISGVNAKDVLEEQICFKMGECVSILHSNNIIHGDVTPSNFILGKDLVVIDFGLSYHSNRIEDKAVDIRLLKEILNSIYPSEFYIFYESFLKGYRKTIQDQELKKILKNIEEIDFRRRYAEVS
jgi:TP53 regulating kinase-like protein